MIVDNPSNSPTDSTTDGPTTTVLQSPVTTNTNNLSPSDALHPYEFQVILEIKEKLTKASTSYCAVPRDKSTFKVRANCNKQISISITQKAKPDTQPLTIERCFGVLLCPGKLVRLSDMHLLDFEVLGHGQGNLNSITDSTTTPPPSYQVIADWKATDKSLQAFNVETPKTDLTVAIDLVLKGIQDPVRFFIETTVQVQSKNESRLFDQMFLSHSSQKRALACGFTLHLRSLGDGQWQSIVPDPGAKEEQAIAGRFSQSFLVFCLLLFLKST